MWTFNYHCNHTDLLDDINHHLISIHNVNSTILDYLRYIGKGVRLMHEEIQALRDKAAAIDAKGDAILALLADVKKRLSEIIDQSADLDAAKVAIAEVSEVLGSQLEQFDAALVEEPTVTPPIVEEPSPE